MLGQIQAHEDFGVSSLSSLSSTSILCSTSADRTAALWDMRTYEKVGVIRGHKDAVNNSVFRDPGTVLTCSDDRTVRVWDSRNLEVETLALKGFKDGVNKSILTADHSAVISACDDGLVYIHALATGELIDSFWVATNTVNDLTLDPVNPSLLLTCSEDCAVRAWKLVLNKDASTEDRLITTFDEFENPVNHLAVHNNWLYAASSECVFASSYTAGSGEFGQEGKSFACHTDYVRGMQFYNDSTLFTAADDCTVVEWCVESAEPVRQVKLHDEMIMALLLHNIGGCDTLISGCEAGLIRFWSLPFQTETMTRAS